MHVRILPQDLILLSSKLTISEGVMSRVAYLKLAYAVAYAFWLMYIVDKFVLVRTATHNRVAVACLLLFGTPPALGYILLFRAFPRAGRTPIGKS
jgi:hypothetical protein